MSIKYAILGLLSWRPSTGYELKKVFEESSYMYWSGNNNQIYKSLLELSKEGLVTGEVQHRESSPSKKIYTITEDGLAELKEFVKSSPEAPELKKTFLVQLAWADLLDDKELNDLLSRYENELNMQLILQKEREKRGIDSPGRSRREQYLWSMLSENVISSYVTEIEWVRRVRKELFEKRMIQEERRINHKTVCNEAGKYVEVLPSEAPMGTEQDALDIIALCGENDTNLLLLQGSALSEDFFRLRTQVAGNMLQKFANYHIKAAAVIPEGRVNSIRFSEMVREANKGSQFRVFDSREDAEKWLLSQT